MENINWYNKIIKGGKELGKSLKKRQKRFIAKLLVAVMLVANVPLFGGTVEASTPLVDGTTVSMPEQGESYYFDFLKNSDLSSGVEGEYGLVDVQGAITKNSHGPVYKNGTSLSFKVVGDVKVSIGNCTYSTAGTGFEVTTTGGSVGELPRFPDKETVACYEKSGQMYSFDYTAAGDDVEIVTINFKSTYYIPYIKIEPIEEEDIIIGVPQQDTTYEYDFTVTTPSSIDLSSYAGGGKIYTQTSYDGLLTLNGNGKMYPHGTKHGLVINEGSSFDIKVAGNAIINLALCEYANGGTVTVSGAASGGAFSKTSVPLKVTTDGSKEELIYVGDATTLTFTISGSGYLHGVTAKNTSEKLDLVKWEQKDFSLKIGEISLDVKGAEAQEENATITLSEGNVYYATSESAFISVNLGDTTLKDSMLTNLSETVERAVVDQNSEIVVTFKDQSTYPSEYRIKVQDTGAFKEPGLIEVYSYDFSGDAVPKEFTKDNGIKEYYTTNDGILTLANGGAAKNPYWHDNAHGLAIFGQSYFDIKVSGDAEISFKVCQYGAGGTLAATGLPEGSEGSFDSNILKSTTDGAEINYTYTGEKATLRFTLSSTGESYLHGITAKNTGTIEDSEVANEQKSMPYVIDSVGKLKITPNGHRLYVEQNATSSDIATLKDVGYYLFEETEEAVTIEADIKINAIGNSSKYGVFFGMANGSSKEEPSMIASLGIRGDKKARNIYHKAGQATASAGSIDKTYNPEDVMHLLVRKEEEGWYSEITSAGETTTALIKYPSTNTNMLKDINTPVRYGFIFANVNAMITNLVLKAEDGTTLYDQRDAYKAIGTAPTVQSVDEPILSEDRTQITVSWSGGTPADDSAYKVEVSKDGGNTYTVLDNHVTAKTYVALVDESGTYQFRISGICGEDTTEAVVSSPIKVLVPLGLPVIKLESGDGLITVNWDEVSGATNYEIYRKSSEETSYSKIATVSELTYKDTNVENETPYYYYVIAKSSDNESNPSQAILSVPSAGRTGEYAYGDEAAEIVLTKKSYDTVYGDQAVLEGIVSKSGKLQLTVNGQVQDEVTVNARDRFSFAASLKEGRNDVNLYLIDNNERVTRKTFNFVYLTSYDMVVDGAYTGVDGEGLVLNPEIKVFSTVQAAVDSVSLSNTQRVTILIKEGNYVEHLVINSPYITLIGEDREKVNLSFYDPIESPEGGDTAKRCAVNIKSSAKGFSAENLTFENDYKYLGDGTVSNESADALRVDADESTFINVKLVGYQDTLQASSNKQYYYKCYILGNVDFIYGAAQAVFNDSEIVYRYNANKNSGYVTAPKTDPKHEYGFIFNNSAIYAEDGCSGSKYLLARPWGQDGAAVFISNYMSGIVNTAKPYADMSGNLAEDARFYEYYTYGEGFAINSNRPQISKKQADEMLAPSFLGWNPYETVEKSENNYIGNIVTEEGPKFIIKDYVEDSADPDSTDDTGLAKYVLEGYASAKSVTGGGLLLKTSEHYYQVATAKEFLEALSNIKLTGKPSAIELTADIGLGSLEIGNAITEYSSIIKPDSKQALLHPTLKETGVSSLKIDGMSNLTIFSENGAKLKHVCIEMNNSSNIIIRNIIFDELWEWDEGGDSTTPGDYDRNDWDYMTIQNGSTGIWIDHCTFYKAYDGIVDVKKADDTDTMDITISWSEFLPESQGSFFNDMMSLLEANPESYPYYYKLLTEHSMTKEQVREYAAPQKKTHLVGASDTEANMKNLRLTLANNRYKNSMDRMPRLRSGSAHIYNTIMDASDIYAFKKTLTDAYANERVVSNGAIATTGGSVLVENSKIDGIIKALLSGNGSSPGGYIGASNTLYYLGGEKQKLNVIDHAGEGLVLDVDKFIKTLPYDGHVLYNPAALDSLVVPYVGAGKVTMDFVQWQKTTYNDTKKPDTGDGGETGGGSDTDDGSGTTGGTTTDDKLTPQEKAVKKVEQAIEELTKQEKEEVAKIMEEYLPYTLPKISALSVEQLKLLTKDKFTKEELETISKNPEILKQLGIDVAAMIAVSTLQPIKNPSFIDMKEAHWANETIKKAAELGIVAGMPDGSFGPNQALKVVDTFTFLDRVLLFNNITQSKLKRSTVEKYIVDKDHWAFYNVASIASKLDEKTLKVISELGSNPISRELLAEVLYEITEGKIKQIKNIALFEDTLTSPYKEAIDYCISVGLFNGTSNTTMSPQKALTRAEMMTVVMRLNDLLQNDTLK